jgi:hypothetical protein
MRHGHVLRNESGAVARCGGPGICSDCSVEASSIKPDGNVHTVPNDSKHYESDACWCGPELRDDFTSQGGKKHYVHRQFQ